MIEKKVINVMDCLGDPALRKSELSLITVIILEKLLEKIRYIDDTQIHHVLQLFQIF